MTSNLDMFRPPVNRAMRLLDRTFFCKDSVISAARVLDIKKMSKIREMLLKSKDILALRQVFPIQPEPLEFTSATSKKCILLRPGIHVEDKSTWGDAISCLVTQGEVNLIPYTLRLEYKHWTSRMYVNYWSLRRISAKLLDEVLSAILPEELLDDMPSAFSHAGHIAQMNLRDAYLPYKHLIGEVIIDKNPNIRTVINKKETLGEENEFRVLDYEVIAGDSDMQVETKEGGCIFRFDYSKVFWNSRLSTEHQRLIEKYFKKGEAVCDVMAGVGPFAIPAAKRGVFVWANDLNPDCYIHLEEAIKTNKVGEFVKPFKEDGHTFIPESAESLLDDNHTARIAIKMSRSQTLANNEKLVQKFHEVRQPRIFSHYVMNLPSTAIDFIPDFIGLYANHSKMFEPYTNSRLPMIHCYCFGPKNEENDPDDIASKIQVCRQLSKKLGHEIVPTTAELELFNVRDVAPNKRQFCASFRLPREVAFRRRD